MLNKAYFSLKQLNRIPFNKSATYFQPSQDVRVHIKDDLLSLQFPFKSGPIMFYVNNGFNLIGLQQTLGIELASRVELELENTSLDLNSNLYKYLLEDPVNPAIKIYAQDQVFNLIPAYQHKEAKFIQTQGKLEHSPVRHYQEHISNDIDPSHANTLSWLMNSFEFLLKQRGSQQLAESEIDNLLKQSVSILGCPIKDRVAKLQHQINLLCAELERLVQNQDKMRWETQERGYQWLSLLFVLSILQIMGFYYGIYMVEEWGWDVCEPFTYTFQCVSVVLGVIFYLRYRRQREFENIRHSFLMKKQVKQRSWRERWEHLDQLIKLKEQEKHTLELQKLILRNRINYHLYVDTINNVRKQ